MCFDSNMEERKVRKGDQNTVYKMKEEIHELPEIIKTKKNH